MEGLEEDIKEVDSLLSVAMRPLVRGRLALLLSDLQQEKRRREMALQNLQMAVTAGLSPLGAPQLGLPAPAPGAVRPPLQASSNMLMEGFPQNLLQSGLVPGGQQVDAFGMAPMWSAGPAPANQRQFSNRSDVSDSAAWMPPPGAHAMVLRGFPNPAWPIGGFNPTSGAGPSAGGDASFRVLTTCSWEQSDAMVKVYVPLRGVQTEMLRATFTPNSVKINTMVKVYVPLCGMQTDMLRATFTPNSVEVKVYDLHGKNYNFTLSPTYQLIAEDNCVAVASKTRKNILITMQKLHSFTPEERQWRDLYGDRSTLAGAGAGLSGGGNPAAGGVISEAPMMSGGSM